jgi:hypothetical protein
MLQAQDDIRRKLIGSWDLVSYDLRTPDGKTTQPLGPDPVGRIDYDSAGHMSAHLMKRGVPNFTSQNRNSATSDEIVGAWRGYIGYFGTYTIDEKAQAIIHHVQGGWFPNYVGTNQVRHYRFDGDRLILQADSAIGHGTIVWKRSR